MGKDCLFHKWYWEKSTTIRKIIILLSHTIQENKLITDYKLKCKTWNRKTPRRKYGQYTLYHQSYQCYFGSVKSGKGNKSKNKQTWLLETKSFFAAKETINKTKRQYNEWEKILANDISDKVLISKIYK